MELQHDGPSDRTTVTDGEGAAAVLQMPLPPREQPATVIAPDHSTAVLRRCTALATRARADLLLTRGRQDASAELARVLAEMAPWDPAALVDPDPTMTVLAAAALQDLAARLPSPAPAGLDTRIEEALPLLRTVMDRGRVSASA
jgi:hypothetical protein